MDLSQTKQVLSILSEIFSYRGNDINVLTMIWQNVFNNNSFNDVSEAVMCYISEDTSGYFPKPAMIKKYIVKKYTKNSKTPGEAWLMVMKALKNSSYNALEEFNNLPEEIQRCYGGPSALQQLAISEDFNESVERSLFERSYNIIMQRKQESLMIPESLKENMICFQEDNNQYKTKALTIQPTTHVEEKVRASNETIDNLLKTLNFNF